MDKDFFISELDFGRAVSTADENLHISDYQRDIIQLATTFGVDQVYFCDEFPAVFIKHVADFSDTNLKEIINIHHKVWNFKKVLQLYIISDFEIRIYNCVERPVYLSDSLTDIERETRKIELYRCSKTDKEKLKTLNNIFSRIAIDTGVIWNLEDANAVKKKINLQRRVDKYLVNSLINVAQKLQQNGLGNIDLIHKLIMRSLFLLFLEDRDATDANFYQNIKVNAESYFDILPDVDATYKLFEGLETHFKGNLFSVSANEKESVKPSHLEAIKRCFINGYESAEQTTLFDNWRLFNFNIIQIELLSEIYENFLSEIDLKEKEETGTFYTPPSLVELILNEKLPINGGETEYKIKILDPACGSGIFLVESFKRLIKRYEKNKNEKLTDYTVLKKLLLDNIFGIEIDPKSVKVAAFSLYLALLENLNPKTLWQKKELPNLINDPEDQTLKEQGHNLFCRDTIAVNPEIESKKFDLILGNPPFGIGKLTDTLRNYCDQYGFAKEMVLPFIHKATLLSPNGDIALIFNTKVLTNGGTTYQNFRKWLFNECYVEKIFNFSILRKAPQNFGGQLFGSAVGPISIVLYKSKAPKIINDRILYYAPKTYVKMDVLEGIVIDKTDLKFLPRELCKDPKTKIWKVAMWGNLNDLQLINKLIAKSTDIGEVLLEKNIQNGVGFQLLTQSSDKPSRSEYLESLPYLDAEHITRYYTNENNLKPIVKSIKTKKATEFYTAFNKVRTLYDLQKVEVFRRLGDLAAYKAPHMVLKKGLENNSICASYLDKDCSFRDGVYGFYGSSENAEFLKTLVGYFNSKLSAYFLFLTISSYGIEREQIMKNEYLSIPFNLNETDQKVLADHVESFRKQPFLMPKPSSIFNDDIESLIARSFDLSERDKILINDIVNINMDLFHRQEKSLTLFPVLDYQPYADMICSEINNLLDQTELKVYATMFLSQHSSPLSLLKLTFSDEGKPASVSKEDLNEELKALDKKLYQKQAANIYFRKKLTYYEDDDIFIIRPNQRRFWSLTMAMEDAADLIVEILNMK